MWHILGSASLKGLHLGDSCLFWTVEPRTGQGILNVALSGQSRGENHRIVSLNIHYPRITEIKSTLTYFFLLPKPNLHFFSYSVPITTSVQRKTSAFLCQSGFVCLVFQLTEHSQYLLPDIVHYLCYLSKQRYLRQSMMLNNVLALEYFQHHSNTADSHLILPQ